MTYSLTIAAPRSQRWYELEHDARARLSDCPTDYSDRRRLDSTHTLAGRCLALLRERGELPTREIAGRLGTHVASVHVALHLLREEGEVCREVRCRQSASGRRTNMWRARS